MPGHPRAWAPAHYVETPLLFLTPGAKMRAALRHQRPPDLSAALRAGLARFLVDVVPHLKTSLAAVHVHIIGDRGASRIDGFTQYLPEGLVKPFQPFLPQSRANRQRMNARAKQRFIGVNVPDAAKKPLVQQHRLDSAFARPQQSREVVERYLERLG